MATSVPAKRTLDEPVDRSKHKTARLDPTEPASAPVPAAARGAGAPLVGARAPAVARTVVVDGVFELRTIGAPTDGSHGDSTWTVLVFIPPAFSCPFDVPARVSDAFAVRRAQVYYVSTDSEYVLRAWTLGNSAAAAAAAAGSRAVFVSDTNFALSSAYDVLQPDTGRALPSTFLIDPQGVVQHVDLSRKPIQTNFEETLRLLDAFQFAAQHGDRVCLANWVKGADSISTSNPSMYFQSH